jgi:hypothetical protein
LNTAGYSGTPLARKLGFVAGQRALVINEPANYRTLLDPLPQGVQFSTRTRNNDGFVHLFTSSRAELAKRLSSLRKQLADAGTLWVSWPKKSSGVPTDITEDVIRDIALPLGFVDVKVCAVDERWSGLKLVIRRELRGNQ